MFVCRGGVGLLVSGIGGSSQRCLLHGTPCPAQLLQQHLQQLAGNAPELM